MSDLEINVHRARDPKPGDLVTHIFPGSRSPLPSVGMKGTLFNLETGTAFAVRVVHVNQELHIYDVRVQSFWILQPRLL